MKNIDDKEIAIRFLFVKFVLARMQKGNLPLVFELNLPPTQLSFTHGGSFTPVHTVYLI